MNMFLAIRAKIGCIRNPVLAPTSGRFVLNTALTHLIFHLHPNPRAARKAS